MSNRNQAKVPLPYSKLYGQGKRDCREQVSFLPFQPQSSRLKEVHNEQNLDRSLLTEVRASHAQTLAGAPSLYFEEMTQKEN